MLRSYILIVSFLISSISVKFLMRFVLNIINNMMLINAFNEIELVLDFFIVVLFVVFVMFTIVGILKKILFKQLED